MNRWILLLLILISPLASQGQNDYYSYFNTDEFWRRLKVDNVPPIGILTSTDTAIIVASNRKPKEDSLRFMSEDRDKDSVRYYLVYTRQEIWHIYRTQNLREAINLLPDRNRDWVVYTEGMGKIFTTDLDRGISLAGQYGVNVLLFDYPSIHSDYKAYKNYRFVMRNSIASYKDFVPVLDTLRAVRSQGAAGTGTLSLFFHSMGNNIIRKIARSGYLDHFNTSVWVDNIILNAPCVPRRGAHRWIDSMHFAKRIYVHYNPQDFTLKWARLAGVRGILGERPKAPYSQQARYVNFNQLCGPGHSNFLTLRSRSSARQASIAHYSKLFHGKDVEIEDGNLYQQNSRIVGWYITGGEGISKR
jgi:hypothetical protein